MRLYKKNPVLAILNEYAVDAPQPSNINYLYNFGSLLSLVLGIQILTGVFLAMHYSPTIDLAFNSVEHNDVFFKLHYLLKNF
jgi:ubiquinol-cytochrome c reductase cytochrome b subunit